MAAEKITLSWDEISSPDVDRRLADLQRATDEASTQAPAPDQAKIEMAAEETLWWLKTPVYMAAFGLLGGLLGWAFGLVVYAGPDLAKQADRYADSYRHVVAATDAGKISREQAELAEKNIRTAAGKNPYFAVMVDASLTDQDRATRLEALADKDHLKRQIGDTLFYSVSALAIAMSLAAAESVVSRNWAGAAVSGSIGAAVGLVGGIMMSLVVGELSAGMRSWGNGLTSTGGDMLARAFTWGILGLIMGLAPGLVMRNTRKLMIGAAGGLIGGIVGGLLFDPLAQLTDSETVSRLLAICLIGVLAGAGTGLIEEAAKLGWLKVTQGLIAGKQFIIYRNPTFIGNSLAAHIYLFKDPQVGRRHAAIHVSPTGYEIEDLPLGGRTFVNGKPIRRARLRNGDQIKIGMTSLLFQEKAKAREEY